MHWMFGVVGHAKPNERRIKVGIASLNGVPESRLYLLFECLIVDAGCLPSEMRSKARRACRRNSTHVYFVLESCLSSDVAPADSLELSISDHRLATSFDAVP